MTSPAQATLPDEDATHYQLLGVPKTAEPTAIRKAYALLIRRFSPEKHPAEFKRIRAAYEELSDATTRKRYDDSLDAFDEHSSADGAILREAQALLNAGDTQEAQDKLGKVLLERPDFHEARAILGMCLMDLEKYPEAKAEFARLVKAQPEDRGHAVSLGYAHLALKELEEGRLEFERATGLGQMNVDAWLGLASALVAQNNAGGAVKRLVDALEHFPVTGPARVTLLVRALHVEVMDANTGKPSEVLPRLLADVAAQNDPELNRYVSSKLTQLAARLFAANRSGHANRVLEKCAQLNPGSAVERPWPSVRHLPVAGLPEATLKWLASLLKDKGNSPTLTENTVSGSATLLGAGALVAMLALWIGLDEAFQASTVLLGPVPLIAGLGALALAFGWDGVAQRLASKLGGGMSLGDVYFLRWTPSQLIARPLLFMTDVHVVRHSTNGVYTHSVVTLQFGEHAESITIQKEDYAQGWAQYALDCRKRALDYLHAGYLDTTNEMEFLPLDLPGMEAAPAPSRRHVWRQAGLGTLVWSVLIVALRLVSEAGAAHVNQAMELHEAQLRGPPEAQWAQMRPMAPGVEVLDAIWKLAAQKPTRLEVHMDMGPTPTKELERAARQAAAELEGWTASLALDGGPDAQQILLAFVGTPQEAGRMGADPAFLVHWQVAASGPGLATTSPITFSTRPPPALNLKAHGDAPLPASEMMVAWHAHQAVSQWLVLSGANQLPRSAP